MNKDEIHKRYQEIGFDLGWRFMMTPVALLTKASICLVGLNPGGNKYVEGAWDFAKGNAYHIEKWRDEERSYSQLQIQIHRMEQILEIGENDYLAAQFVPFRSPNWKSLRQKMKLALAFGRELWAWTLEQSPARLFLCLGNDAAMELAKLLKCQDTEETYPVNWEPLTIGRRIAPDGRVVIRIPHLSRFQIFGRSEGASAIAEKSLREATRLCL
jgi:hypothetical protein